MKQHLFAIFVLAIFMIALPLHLRFAHNNPTLAGTEPYYHSRMAVEILKGIPATDTAIANGRPYILHPYHIVLAGAYALIGPLAFNLLPGIFALLSFVFFWLLLRKLGISENTQPWILLAYALSPPLLATGTIGTPHAFILALLMGGTWLLLGRLWMLGSIFYVIACLSGLIYNVTAICFLLVLLLIYQKDTQRFIVTALLSIGAIVLGHTPPLVALPRELSQYISDFGGVYGFSIFAFLLALVGAALAWKRNQKTYATYAIFIGFFVASFFFPHLLVFANVVVSALAGVALAKLSQRKWELHFLRQAALLVLFCGLLFSSISHAVSLADTPPTPAFFKALEFPPGTVVTYENYGFWVESAGHTALMDPLWKELADPEDQSWDVAALFKSTDLAQAIPLLKKYNVTNVLITSEMEHGLLWERDEQGLDFLVKNSETFKKLKTSSNINVWKVR
jgi:hypothetical protein